MAIKLPRLSAGFKIINRDGTPTSQFIQWWQQVAQNVEVSINGITAALEAAGIALDAADVALAAAAAAQGATDATASETSLTNSYIAGFTPPLISADDTGDVTIADHQRVYGDPALNPTAPITGATISTGLGVGAVVRVYYDDPARAGGAVTYQYTVDPAPPPVQAGDRHSVGAVTVPATGVEGGNYLKPPGYVDV